MTAPIVAPIATRRMTSWSESICPSTKSDRERSGERRMEPSTSTVIGTSESPSPIPNASRSPSVAAFASAILAAASAEREKPRTFTVNAAEVESELPLIIRRTTTMRSYADTASEAFASACSRLNVSYSSMNPSQNLRTEPPYDEPLPIIVSKIPCSAYVHDSSSASQTAP